ncbi:MAG: formylmethanofuran dehydrogenase subunit B [candidate division NC10 bacterium]|nr:formylmethanofuran dehydrogenase subunit B [candidate division NC10 bacterium]MDE2322698.1 formylmethanofuran dehydrogenase subunit B [candidate division NC10 bacterium]
MAESVAVKEPAVKEPYVMTGVVCPFCGVTCDDLEVKVENGKIVEVKNACVLGKATFLHHLEGLSTPRIHGKPATVDECIDAAAEILAKAKYPLIYGLDSTELGAQRASIELADLIGANIDHTSSVCHAPSYQAVMTVGIPTCTSGETKNRADLVIFWGCNPAEAHPRHATRYSVTVKGMFTPKGKKDRMVIHVDVRPTPTTRIADAFIQMKPNSDYEVISALRALVRGHELPQAEVGGIPVDELKALVEKMKSAKFGIIYWGMGLTQTRGKYLNLVALLKLAQDLNQFTKFSCAAMRGHGNVVGMAQVLTWQTGFPFHVNMSRGYPRFNPGEFSVVDMLARKEIDASLVIAGDAIGNFPGSMGEHLKSIPLIAIDPKESDTTRVADIVIPSAQGAIGAGGMAYRMDHIPLLFKKVVESPYPSDREILERIIAKIKAIKSHSNAAPAPAGRG